MPRKPLRCLLGWHRQPAWNALDCAGTSPAGSGATTRISHAGDCSPCHGGSELPRAGRFLRPRLTEAAGLPEIAERVLTLRRALSAVLVLFGLTVTLCPPSSAAPDPLGGKDFSVIARVISERDIDLGEKGPSIGDYFIFHERLMKRGERVGTDSGRCDLIRATNRTFAIHCMVTLTFAGKGQLTVQGAIKFKRGKNADPVLAITGGTGDFAGASGEFVLNEGQGPTRYEIHLD
jgi:hypothetical protein